MKRVVTLSTLTLLAVLAGCGERGQPTAPVRQAPARNPSISDGAHNLGNGNFFFLPPMVASPVNDPNFATNPFNGDLRPRVEICTLVDVPSPGTGKQCGSSFVKFDETQIAVSQTDQLYQVNWDTKGTPAIDVNAFYRIQVFVGSKMLGYADVDPVSNGSQLKNVDTQDYIGLVDGRTLPIKFTIHHKALCLSTDCAEMYVGNTGAVVKTSTGFAAASFPNGWLPAAFQNQQVLVTIDRVPFTSTSQCHPTTIGLTQFEGCYHFATDPSVGAFNMPVRVEVCTAIQSTDAIYHSLQLFSSGPNEPVHALSDDIAPDVGCEGFTTTQIGTLPSNSLFRFASAGVHAIGRGLSSIFSVKPAYAIHLGLGGDATAFSNIGWASLSDLQLITKDFSATAGTTSPVTVRVVRNHSSVENADGGGDVPIPVAGDTVTFVPSAGTVVSTNPTDPAGRAVTDANGYATVNWTLGSAIGTQTLAVASPNASGSFTLTATATGLQVPALAYTSSEQYTTSNGELTSTWDRYSFTVTNLASYPTSLFAPRTGATSCVSQTEVDFYDASTDQYIYGFCGLSSPSDLNGIWFSVPRWTQPPAAVYIRFIDATTRAVIATSNTVSLYGPLFTDYPRQVELDWPPVTGATGYQIEVDYCESWQTDWRNCNTAWQPLTRTTTDQYTTSYQEIFVGDQPGRWRAGSVDANGGVTWSDYKFFNYRTPPSSSP